MYAFIQGFRKGFTKFKKKKKEIPSQRLMHDELLVTNNRLEVIF